MKTQGDLTFDEAKQLACSHLAILAEFMEQLNILLGDKIPLNCIYDIRVLELKVSKATIPCISQKEFLFLNSVAEGLTNFCPDISPQLSNFWRFYYIAFDMMRQNPSLPKIAPREKVQDLNSKIMFADKLYGQVIIDGKNHDSEFVFVTALLLTHVIRCESIEYPIWKQLSDIVKSYGLNEFDPAMICSIYNKVPKYHKRPKCVEWRSDVRAIRDAIAHGHFNIWEANQSTIIAFDNSEEGYNFKMEFSLDNFYKFFDLHTMLLKVQLALLVFLELLPLLAIHFLKKS